MNYYKIAAIVVGIMLLLAIPSGLWPYVYYQILREVVTITAVIGAIMAFNENKQAWVWILGIVAVVFNPIAPLYLAKETWAVIDFVAAIVMFYSATIKLTRDI